MKTSDHSSMFCSETLRIIKISWNSNYCTFHFVSKVSFSGGFHFTQYHSRYLLRGIHLLLCTATDFHVDHRLVCFGYDGVRDKLLVGLN
mmetsp:Transcript_12300/g.18875  ORF Transcript_12300/g.18875 Transcript_12300/m.18875 type:complete len:89 (+) Transcript_12300:2517-2783(+)